MRNKFLVIIMFGVSITPAVLAAEPRELSKLSEFPSGSYLCGKSRELKKLPGDADSSQELTPKSGTAVSASESASHKTN